jgi:integrase
VFKRMTKDGRETESTDVNFQVLRRTCATLFGAKAKDPRDTQAQLRHADPTVTLKHYQKSIPSSVKAAARALEDDLMNIPVQPTEQVLNRLDFLEGMQPVDFSGATRRDRTGDLLITKKRST